VLPIRLQPGEKAFVMGVELLYATNDTDKEWHFDLTGELWDGQTDALHIIIPPFASKGAVPALDRLVYKNEVVAKWSEFIQYLGQEHAILGAHSTCNNLQGKTEGWQLFSEKDPFLQFVKQHWSLFPDDLAESDVVLIECGDIPIYQVSQRAIERVSRFFKTVFSRIKYKTRTTHPLRLCLSEQSKPAATTEGKGGFSGIVMMLSLDYVIIAPAAPKCRVLDYPLNLII
jgi:hypothetical protein